MNVKEHAKSEHQKSESYHLHKSTHHRKLSEAHGRLADHLAKADDADEAACHRELSAIHAAAASVEAERAEHHRHMADLVDAMEIAQPYMARKAAGVSVSGDALREDQITAIIGEVPIGVRPVTRHGQPPMPSHAPVDLEFQHLVKVEDDE